jgi:hypothetical protein
MIDSDLRAGLLRDAGRERRCLMKAITYWRPVRERRVFDHSRKSRLISVGGLYTGLLWSAYCGRQVDDKNDRIILSNSSTFTGFVI